VVVLETVKGRLVVWLGAVAELLLAVIENEDVTLASTELVLLLEAGIVTVEVVLELADPPVLVELDVREEVLELVEEGVLPPPPLAPPPSWAMAALRNVSTLSFGPGLTIMTIPLPQWGVQ